MALEATVEPASENARLESHLRHYLQTNTRIRSDRSREHYWRSFRQLAEHLGRDLSGEDLTDDNLSSFLLATVRAGHAEVTANQRVKQLRAFWNWCAKRRIVEQFPTFRDLVEPEPMPEAWSDDELHLLFTGCARQTGWIGPHQASTWWLSIHWWWLATAERTEATMLVERSMIDLDKRIAKVPARIRKGGRKNQIYHLPHRLCELLEPMFIPPSPSGRIWEHPWKSWRNIYCRYRKLLADSNLPHVRGKSGPKKMRVTVLTRIEASGGDAAKFARHSDRRVTEHYLDQAVLAAHSSGVWPPQGLDPEGRPKSWRNAFGLLGAG
jgi:integrase